MGVKHASDGRPLPWPNPTTKPFFDAAREHRLVLQRCPRDGFFFYPRSRCPACLGRGLEVGGGRGRGRVHSFTVDRVGHVPALRALAPYAVAIVELEAGSAPDGAARRVRPERGEGGHAGRRRVRRRRRYDAGALPAGVTPPVSA